MPRAGGKESLDQYTGTRGRRTRGPPMPRAGGKESLDQYTAADLFWINVSAELKTCSVPGDRRRGQILAADRLG